MKTFDNKEKTILNTRKFIFSLLRSLNQTIDYCLVRGSLNELNPLTSDIDLMVNKKDYGLFINALEIKQSHLKFKIVNIIKRQYVYTHILYLEDEKIFTQIDTEFDFDWWGFTIMTSSSILNRKTYNEEGVFIASSKDISIMKLYRSLFWGKRISKKYESQDIIFDKNYLENNSTIKLNNNQNVEDLLKYYSTDTEYKIKILRKKVVKANFKSNKIKTVMKFVDFLMTEIKLLRSNNGVHLHISGEEYVKLDFLNQLTEYIDFFNAPFKSYTIESSISFIQNRKKMRDSFVIITNNPKNSQYQIYVTSNEVVIMDNSLKKISFTRQDINEIIKFIYQ